MALFGLRQCGINTRRLLPQKHLIRSLVSSLQDIITIIYICAALCSFQTQPCALTCGLYGMARTLFPLLTGDTLEGPE